jgi:microcystin-dependent protein
MYKNIDFSQPGGFPLTQDVLAFMQSSYRDALAGIAQQFGELTIISGVVVTGSTVSDGWIVYEGELVRFVGSTLSAQVVVDTLQTQLMYEDGANRTVLFEKRAYCGSPGTFDFADLKRLNTQWEQWLPGDIKMVTCTHAYINANFTPTGLGINERRGWAICNGQNGTVDMRSRFAIGWDDRNVDPNDERWDTAHTTMQNTGGLKRVQLTVAELPPHNHAIQGSTSTSFAGAGAVPGVNPDGSESAGQTLNQGSGLSHENRPPFIVTLYIQRISWQ